MLRGQAAPTHAPGVLQVPSVHVVEGVHVQIVAGHEANGGDCCDPRAQQEHIPCFDLAREAPHEAAVELVIVALGIPWSGVPRADQRDAVPQEDVGIRARCRPSRDLPDSEGRGSHSADLDLFQFADVFLRQVPVSPPREDEILVRSVWKRRVGLRVSEVGRHRDWPLLFSIEEDQALAPVIRVLVSSWPEALRDVELADIEIGNIVH